MNYLWSNFGFARVLLCFGDMVSDEARVWRLRKRSELEKERVEERAKDERRG
jgi:hypothetical protein